MDGYIADKNNLSEPEVSDKLEALDIEWQIFFIILYSFISIMALFENLIVIFVQMFGKSFDPIVRKCLINLAIADICVGVLSVPFSYTDFMLGRWIFPHIMCPIAQFSVLLSVFVTCHTLTLISFERYANFNYILIDMTYGLWNIALICSCLLPSSFVRVIYLNQSSTLGFLCKKIGANYTIDLK